MPRFLIVLVGAKHAQPYNPPTIIKIATEVADGAVTVKFQTRKIWMYKPAVVLRSMLPA
jgi:hypothetical protein